MRNPIFILSLLILLTSHSACDKSSSPPPYQDDAFQYFPLEDDNYWIYDAVFINIDALIGIYDTNRVQLRMDYIEYDEDLLQHVLQRRIRIDSNEVWQEYDVVLVKVESLTIQWNENNTRYVKLTDPVYENKSWDGNIYNILDKQDYYYSEVNTTFEIGDTVFSPCVRVEKNEIENVIQSINAYEVFAKEVGPVYEYDSDFSLQSGEISIGYSRELTLIKFGKL